MTNVTIYIAIMMAAFHAEIVHANYQDRSSIEYFRAFPLADRGYSLIKQDKYVDATELFRKATKILPENVEYRIQLINLLVIQNETIEARQVVESGLEIYPNNKEFIKWKEDLKEQEKIIPDKLDIATPVADKHIKIVKKEVQKPLAAQSLPKKDMVSLSPSINKVNVFDPCKKIGITEKISYKQNLEVAYCALDKGDETNAIKHFNTVLDSQDINLQLLALKQLGFLYINSHKYKEASSTWEKLLKIDKSNEVTLFLSRSLRLQEEYSLSLAQFNKIDITDLTNDLHQLYLNEAKNLSDHITDIKQAIEIGIKSLNVKRSPEQYYYQALRLQKLGDNKSAIEHLEQAYKLEPDNSLFSSTLAYAYRNEKMNSDAIDLFYQSIRSHQGISIREDLAYTLKDEGRRKEAANQLRHVYKEKSDPKDIYNIRRDIQQLEDDWQFFGSATYRDGIARSAGLAGVKVFDDSLQYGIEAIYSPPLLQKNGRRVQLYGQSFVSSNTGSYKLNEDSTQSAFGIRTTPLANTEWYVSLARLVGVGDDAVDDFQIRTFYSYTDGFDIKPYADDWRYSFVSTDISYTTKKEEMFATTEMRYGHSYHLDEEFVMTPHLVMAGALQDNPDINKIDAVEIGIGISLRTWFSRTDARASRGNIDLITQWREPILGNDDNKSGLFVRLVIQY